MKGELEERRMEGGSPSAVALLGALVASGQLLDCRRNR